MFSLQQIFVKIVYKCLINYYLGIVANVLKVEVHEIKFAQKIEKLVKFNR